MRIEVGREEAAKAGITSDNIEEVANFALSKKDIENAINCIEPLQKFALDYVDICTADTEDFTQGEISDSKESIKKVFKIAGMCMKTMWLALRAMEEDGTD